MKNSQNREFSRTAVRSTNRQESRLARIAPEGCGIGICRMNGDIQEVCHEKLSGQRSFTHTVRPKGDIHGGMS